MYLSPEAKRLLQAAAVIGLALVPLAFFSVFTTALRGMQRMDAYMALNLAASLLQVAAALLFVRPGGSGTSRIMRCGLGEVKPAMSPQVAGTEQVDRRCVDAVHSWWIDDGFAGPGRP